MPDRDEFYSKCKVCGSDHGPNFQHREMGKPAWTTFRCPETGHSWEHTTALGERTNAARGAMGPGNPTIGRRLSRTYFSIPELPWKREKPAEPAPEILENTAMAEVT